MLCYIDIASKKIRHACPHSRHPCAATHQHDGIEIGMRKTAIVHRLAAAFQSSCDPTLSHRIEFCASDGFLQTIFPVVKRKPYRNLIRFRKSALRLLCLLQETPPHILWHLIRRFEKNITKHRVHVIAA